MARASLAAEIGPAVQDELSLTHKRKLEELEVARLETELITSKRAADSKHIRMETEHLITKRAADYEHLTKCTSSYARTLSWTSTPA